MVFCSTPIISVLLRQRQEDKEFQASLSYMRPCLKKWNKQSNKHKQKISQTFSQASNIWFLVLVIIVTLGTKPKATHRLRTFSTSGLYLQPLIWVFLFVFVYLRQVSFCGITWWLGSSNPSVCVAWTMYITSRGLWHPLKVTSHLLTLKFLSLMQPITVSANHTPSVSTWWCSCFWASSWSCWRCSSSFYFCSSSAFFLSSFSCIAIMFSYSFSSSSVNNCCWPNV